MVPGDPYRTEALDELRAAQREALDVLRDSFLREEVANLSTVGLGKGDIANPGRLEVALRKSAGELLAKVAPLIDHERRRLERMAVYGAVRSLNPDWVDDLMSAHEKLAPWSSDDATSPIPGLAADATILLVLADQVAEL